MSKPPKPFSSVPAKGQGRSPLSNNNAKKAAKASPLDLSGSKATPKVKSFAKPAGTKQQIEEHFHGFSKRLVFFLAILIVALLLLTPILSNYANQQQQLHELQNQVEQKQNQVQTLEQEIARWNDPTFVAAQARERLLFALPGETHYRLTDSSGKLIDSEVAQKPETFESQDSWYAIFWDSLVASSKAAAPDQPALEDEAPSGQVDNDAEQGENDE